MSAGLAFAIGMTVGSAITWLGLAIFLWSSDRSRKRRQRVIRRVPPRRLW